MGFFADGVHTGSHQGLNTSATTVLTRLVYGGATGGMMLRLGSVQKPRWENTAISFTTIRWVPPKWWRWFDVFRTTLEKAPLPDLVICKKPALPAPKHLSQAQRAQWKRRLFVQGLYAS